MLLRSTEGSKTRKEFKSGCRWDTARSRSSPRIWRGSRGLRMTRSRLISTRWFYSSRSWRRKLGRWVRWSSMRMRICRTRIRIFRMMMMRRRCRERRRGWLMMWLGKGRRMRVRIMMMMEIWLRISMRSRSQARNLRWKESWGWNLCRKLRKVKLQWLKSKRSK